MKRNTRARPLTKTQAKVLALLEQKQTNRQIAETLNRSEHTIKRHVEQVLAKTGVERRWQLFKPDIESIRDDEIDKK
ncbi:MAG: helix-turn-helix transcriptional regulator [Betaproteobacteria bacterium]|nr:helix-turn-helix transcriptional regulator [Betaproteobacteria bacterium]